MKTETADLMKHFAGVLRGRALGKLEIPSIDPNLSRYFSRKELIGIIQKRFGGSIPKQHNLVEMENEELVGLIEDEMYVISYMTEKWSRVISEKKEPVPKKAISKPEKPKTNGKKDKATAQP